MTISCMAPLLLQYLLLTVSCLVKCSENYYPLHVFIDPLSGEDTRHCLDSNSSLAPCKTLPFVAENLTRKNSVDIKVLCEELILIKSADFERYTNLSLSGGRDTTLRCNHPGVGLSFTLVEGLTLFSIRVEKCGCMRPSTAPSPNKPQQTLSLSVAVYILNCTNVAITSFDILLSNGIGLSIYDTVGRVSIKKCNFSKNGVSLPQRGGGGLHLEFTICTPGLGNCSVHDGRNSGSLYLIEDCTFIENSANCPFDEHEFISPTYTPLIPRTGKGGGIYISIGSDATNNTILITNTQLYRNTAVFNSGGMLLELVNSATNNSIILSDVSFRENKCGNPSMKYCAGGGLLLGYIFYEATYVHGPAKRNTFMCTDCTFEANVAYIGGGVGILVSKRRKYSDASIITFSETHWRNNKAPIGAAVYAAPDTWDYTEQGILPSPLFRNCSFFNNSAFYTYSQTKNGLHLSSPGYGAVFSTELQLNFEGKTTFKNNNGSGLYLSNSVIIMGEGSYATFDSNVGHNGGAIAMLGYSLMEINNNSLLTFSNNRAYSMGGAIFSDVTAALQPARLICFIQPSSVLGVRYKVKSTLHFKKNSAGLNGDAIFTTSFNYCKFLCPQNTSTSKPENMLNCIANFVFDTNSSALLATHPTQYELESPVHMIPGSEYHLTLTARDEANNTPFGLVYHASVDPHSTNNIHLDSAFTEVSNNTIMLHGQTGTEGKLYLSTYDNILSFNVHLMDCQPGYILNSKGTCKCKAPDYLGLVPTCGPTLYLRDGYWMGPCSKNSTTLCTTYCPYGFCSYQGMDPTATIHPLPNSTLQLETQLCGPNRHGAVCSLCAQNNSVYFHSLKYRCGPETYCHFGWLFYFVTEFLPLIVFYVVILYFNVSFTHGNSHCFVFYAQVLSAIEINANGTVRYAYFVELLHDIEIFIYSPLNLDFFSLEPLSFCLWGGAKVIDMMIMKCVTGVLAFMLVFVTILLTRLKFTNKLLQHYTPNGILIHGLSAFVILCYSQVTHIAFHILTYFCLYSAHYDCEEKIVNYMEYMIYFQDEHLKYAIPAVLVVIFFVVLLPLMLLIYPLLFKALGLCQLSESWLAVALSRLMPIQLLDAFQGSFKDNFRFFAGLYFLYRAIILCAFAYCTTLLQFYAVIQLQLLLMIAVHSLVQPYKERKHNITDALLFTNLAIINGMTIYAFAEGEFGDKPMSRVGVNVMAVVQVILIFLPLVCVVIIAVRDWKRKKRNLDNSDRLPSLRSCETNPLLNNFT